jgi:hypothetical protein
MTTMEPAHRQVAVKVSPEGDKLWVPKTYATRRYS